MTELLYALPGGAADAGAEPDVLPAAEEDAPPPQAVSREKHIAIAMSIAIAFFISITSISVKSSPPAGGIRSGKQSYQKSSLGFLLP